MSELNDRADFNPALQAAGADAISGQPTGVPAGRLTASPAEAAPAGEYGQTSDAYDHTQMGRFAKIVAVHAGIGTPSTSAMLTERLAEATRRALEADSRLASVTVIALRPLVGDIASASVGGVPSGELQAAIDALAAADGVIAVSPVFQGSYSGLFKSFFDVLPDGTLRGAPLLIGATAGTARHSLVTEMALRPLFSYLKALPTALAVFAAAEDFGATWSQDEPDSETLPPLAERVERAGGELAQFIERFPRSAPVDPMADFTPMDALLKRRH